jgi:hypothetical protein
LPVGSLWVSENKHSVVNVIYAATLWMMWITRNDLYFNRKAWSGLQVIWRKTARMFFSNNAKESFQAAVVRMEQLAKDLLCCFGRILVARN